MSKKIFVAFITFCIAISVFTSVLSIEENDTHNPPKTLKKPLPSILHYPDGQTKSIYTKTQHGGIQHIVAKSTNDIELIKLIHAYLFKITEQFKKGDFSMTERLYNADMPGLTQLKTAKLNAIKFEYRALETGGQIHFSSKYPQYITALHEWLEIQAREHGNFNK